MGTEALRLIDELIPLYRRLPGSAPAPRVVPEDFDHEGRSIIAALQGLLSPEEWEHLPQFMWERMRAREEAPRRRMARKRASWPGSRLSSNRTSYPLMEFLPLTLMQHCSAATSTMHSKRASCAIGPLDTSGTSSTPNRRPP